MILNEGGNVFPDVTPFDHAQVPEILKTVQRALSSADINVIPVGSAATPRPGKKSGDMDVIADEERVLKYFKAKDAKAARKALSDFISAQGLQTAQTGINVHVRVPVGTEAHQVDIMITPKAERIAKFHTHDIPEKSPFKGVNKQLMLAILAKQKGYMWSAWQGLFARDEKGKKADFISDDLDEIAVLLLGPRATSKNLGSVEAILQSLPNEQAASLLARAEQDPNWVVKKPSNEAIDRMRQLAGLAEAAPQEPAQPTTPAKPVVDPKNYKVPSIEYLKKNFQHPANVIDGAWPSETDPERIGAWKPGSDYDDLVMALSGSQYRAAKADPSFRVVPVKDDWEYVQRLLGTPEGKEYAVDTWVGLSSIADKSQEAEFQRSQQKEFEKQRNARELAQKDNLIKPGWKWDPETGSTPAFQRAQSQAPATQQTKEALDAMLRIARLK